MLKFKYHYKSRLKQPAPLLSEILDYHHECHRNRRASCDAKEPLQPIEEIEGLQRKEQETIEEHQQEGVPEISGHADGTWRWLQVVGTVPWHKELEEIGLHQSYQCHGRRSHARCVGEDVDTQAQEEAPQESRPAWLVSAKVQHQDDIKQWRGTVEEVYVIEHQALNQHQGYK